MTPVYAHINLSYLEQMCDGDQEMRHTMLGMILQELPDEIKKLKPLCAQKNWSELHAISHKLKSTLSFVGNDVMTDINKKIELNSKLGLELDGIENLIKSLLTALPNVITDLKSALSHTY